MQNLYKIEIFSQNYAFKSVAMLNNPQISMDYLTLEKTTLDVPLIEASRGDFVHVTDFYGDVIYQGVIQDIADNGSTYSLSAAPLLSLLDVQVQYDYTIFETQPLEQNIASIITSTYINNADSLQNIPGLTVAALTSTEDTPLDIRSNIHAFWDIITSALTLYDIVVTAELKPQDKEIAFTVQKVTEAISLEAELKNCLSKTFVLTDNYGTLNKMTFVDKNNESNVIVYYLHPDGSITQQNEDRITPVFFSAEYIEITANEDGETDPNDFRDTAYQRAYEAMTPEKYQHSIELSYREDDPMVQPNTIQIGTMTTIYYNNNAYVSILTGYRNESGVRTLLFGCIRLELTKKLILEKRRAANDNA